MSGPLESWFGVTIDGEPVEVVLLGESSWDPVNGFVARDYANDTVTMDSTAEPWWLPGWVIDAAREAGGLGAIEGET